MKEKKERKSIDKILLKTIEDACYSGTIDYYDLIDMGLDFQRKQVDEICKSALNRYKSRMSNDPLDSVRPQKITYIPKPNLN